MHVVSLNSEQSLEIESIVSLKHDELTHVLHYITTMCL